MTNLTVPEVKAAKHSGRTTENGKQRPERIGDGAGLYLQIAPGAKAGEPGNKSWLFRYSFAGKAREMGLGRVALADGKPGVTLAAARRQVADLHAMLREGVDPIAEREAKRARAAAADDALPTRAKTFQEVAALCMAAKKAEWKSRTHRDQWEATLTKYAFPHFGKRPVADVDTDDVMAALDPIWTTKTETATRLRQRIEVVLDYAAARAWRTGANPARWRGHLANLLAKPAKIATVKHHPALPWAEVGAFLAALRQRHGIAARALEFCILTAARSGEVRGARWSEIDLARAVWTVPAERMKAGREHRVPLSRAAVAVLRDVMPLRDAGAPDPLVFPGRGQGKPLSENTLNEVLERMSATGRPWLDQRDGRPITTHGFRSSFRDWAGKTSFEREVIEKALAHVVAAKGSAEAAYWRDDVLEKRAKLMDAWAAYCARPAHPAEVLPLARRAG